MRNYETPMPLKKSSGKRLVDKIERYCAFQERCKQDVRIKLIQLGVAESSIDSIIRQLDKKGFVNEARYAKAFARDKFNLHQWGRIKIEHALQQKNIPQRLIDEGLAEIEDAEYRNVLQAVFGKKQKELSELKDDLIRNDRIATYLIGKGFEPELVWEVVNKR